MAGSKHFHGEDKGKVRVRFMEVELEGSNQTLLEGIRHITSAIPAQVIVKQVSGRTSPVRSLGNGGEMAADAAATVDARDLDGGDAGDANGDETEVSEVAPISTPKKPRTAPKAPALATNLREGDSPTLQEFCVEVHLSPDADAQDRAIVVATWLKETRGISEMGASEFYTCCRLMDWTLPTDLTSPMRKLKGQKKMDSSEPGKWFLTLLGEKHFKSLKNGA
jgi:hypothetical protein